VEQRVELLEKVRKKLLDRREIMMQELTELSSEKVSDGQVQDSGDEALTLTMEKLQTSLEQTEIDELRLIDDALGRIKKSEYGFCIDCAQSIADRRLETFPYAARCIVCQETVEGR